MVGIQGRKRKASGAVSKSEVEKPIKVSKKKESGIAKSKEQQPEISAEDFPSTDEEDYSDAESASSSSDEEVENDSEKDDSDNDKESYHLAGFESADEEESGSESETEKESKSSRKLELDSKDEAKIKQKISELPKDDSVKGKKEKKSTGPGVLYIGRIPHGFYEEQMRDYFSQFGEVTRIRLSRNKKTGKSKHYAFVEMGSAKVAEIVAETMNNYLLFGHLLKVEVIPPSKVHDKLFINANKKFRVMPWDKIAKHQHDRPRTQEHWEKLKERNSQRLSKKNKKLTDMGIDYTYEKSELKDKVNQEQISEKTKLKGKKTKSKSAKVAA